MLNKIFNVGIIFIGIATNIFAQMSDTITQSKIDALQKKYNQQIKNPEGFLSGTLYTKQYPNFSNHQFFEIEQWSTCKIYHNAESFDYKFARYDIYNDVLIVLKFTTEGSKFIQLSKEYITAFEINGHKFDYISFENPKQKSIYPKYCEILIEGKYSLYKSSQKAMIKATESTYGHFDNFTRYFIKTDGSTYEANNLKELRTVFTNSEIGKYIETNNLTFTDYESDLIGMIEKLNKK